MDLQREVTDRNRWAAKLDRSISMLQSHIQELTHALAQRETTLELREARIRTLRKQNLGLMAQLDQLRNHLAEVELLAQLNLDGSAHAHGDPISVPARISSGDRGRILFLQSGSPESALRCLEVLQTAVFTDVRLFYITPTTHVAPARTNLPSDTEVIVTGNSLVELLSLRALIRCADFESCVLMFTGELGFRRLKFLGLTL